MQRWDVDLRWDDLKVFLALAASGSTSSAADELGVNVTTVYRRLDALEETLAARLFDRSAGYALTPVGHDVLDHARNVQEEALALQRRVSGHDRQASGPVRVTLPESLLELVLPLLWSFRRDHPRIVPVVETGDRMFDLERREADVAIRPSSHPPEHVVGRRVAGVAWGTYRRRERGAEAPEALPWVVYDDVLAEVAAVAWWRRHHEGEPAALLVSTVPAMAVALDCGAGRGMLPCFVGDRRPHLERVGEPPPDASSALWLLIQADLRRSARVRALVDALFPALRALAPIFEGRAPESHETTG